MKPIKLETTPQPHKRKTKCSNILSDYSLLAVFQFSPQPFRCLSYCNTYSVERKNIFAPVKINLKKFNQNQENVSFKKQT